MSLLTRLHNARLIWPALMTAAALPVLLGLGTWQLSRKTWKEGLIAGLETRAHAAPVSIDEVLRRPAADVFEREYTRVAVRGHYLHAYERLLYALDDDLGPGEHVYTPFETADGRWLVMINRGFVTAEKKLPKARAEGQVSGDTEVVGLVRAGETKGTFEPANDVAHNQWFFRDIAAMAAGVPLATGRQVAPFALAAEKAPAPPGGWPKGGVTRLVLPNRHLEYVLTWYGLAAALLAVFAMFANERLHPAADADGDDQKLRDKPL